MKDRHSTITHASEASAVNRWLPEKEAAAAIDAGQRPDRSADTPVGARERALRHIVAEVQAGLRHGYFDYALTCEVIGHGRRRLVLRAGKNYQFVIAAEECDASDHSSDPHQEGAERAT